MSLEALVQEVRACTLCAPYLADGVRPVLQARTSARLLITGQAPGRRVHASGIPFDDASGERLRAWMGVSKQQFYDPEQVAILPMGFCYPGTGKSGDLPPRPECAATWRARLLAHLPNLELVLLIGKYAHDYHLDPKRSLTENVLDWRAFGPKFLPLPHPSPRNNLWLRRNPWFEAELVPVMQDRIAQILT